MIRKKIYFREMGYIKQVQSALMIVISQNRLYLFFCMKKARFIWEP